jgi:glycosyltransferase involved in cell wall biosynthesis
VTESPAVSVIMTVYNGERYLSEAIDSIRQQDLHDWELVIVDDGSEDHTPGILAEAQAADPRITVISKPRVGRARALNLAWVHTRALYVANLDADDLAEPGRLRKQLTFLEQHPEVGLLGTAWTRMGEDEDGRRTERIVHPPLTDAELRKALVRHNPFYHSSVMMLRRALQDVGGYDEHLNVGLDYDLQVRISCRYQVANLRDVLATQRCHRWNYFGRVPTVTRYGTVVKIRWVAWRSFSRRVSELPHVLNPIGMLRDFFGLKLRRAISVVRHASYSASE